MYVIPLSYLPQRFYPAIPVLTYLLNLRALGNMGRTAVQMFYFHQMGMSYASYS
jgi:hypothetical protein